MFPLKTCNKDVKTEVIILNNDTITDVIKIILFICNNRDIFAVITSNKFY